MFQSLLMNFELTLDFFFTIIKTKPQDTELLSTIPHYVLFTNISMVYVFVAIYKDKLKLNFSFFFISLMMQLVQLS